jgi:hypothetical protein
VLFPDGRKDTYDYAPGEHSYASPESIGWGTFDDTKTTPDLRTIITHLMGSNPVADKSTRETIITGPGGRERVRRTAGRPSTPPARARRQRPITAAAPARRAR